MSFLFRSVRAVVSLVTKWAPPRRKIVRPAPVVRGFFESPARGKSPGVSVDVPRLYVLPKDECSVVVVWHVQDEKSPSFGTLRVFDGLSRVHEADVDLAKGAYEVTRLTSSGRYRAEIQTSAHGVFRSEHDIALPPVKPLESVEVTWATVRMEKSSSVIDQVHSRPRPPVAVFPADETVSSSRFTGV